MKGLSLNIISAIFSACLMMPLAHAGDDTTEMKATTSEKSSGPISLNKASVEELSEMKGVGDAKAKAIIDYREEKGGFKNLEELTQVKGIGPSILESNRPLLSLE
jgi:competence protein ComEA